MNKTKTLLSLMVLALLIFPILPCLTGNGDCYAGVTSAGDNALAVGSSEVEYPGIVLEESADDEEEGEEEEDEYYEEGDEGDDEDADYEDEDIEDEDTEDEEDSGEEE